MHGLSRFSHVRLSVTLGTVAWQASLSMGFSRQEYWSGLPQPPLGDLPQTGTEAESLTSPALAVRFFTTDTTWEDFYCQWYLSLYIMVFVYDVIIRVAEIP